MDARVLQRLRRRVDRGDRLSDAELSVLRTAADAHGEAARITLGLALSNAGDVAEALSVLGGGDEALAPSFAQARARALVSAERSVEAERVLARSVAAHPRDVGLRKSLAVLALRRGDPAEAGRWLAEACGLAPEDGDAEALARGLDDAGADGCTLESLFARRRRAAWAWLWPHGGRAHGSLRARWTDDGEPTPSHDGVLPLLLASAPVGTLTRDGPAGLVLGYARDGVPVRCGRTPATDARRLEAVDRTAWRNVALRLAVPRPVVVDRGRPRLSPEPLGLWALCEADGADAARLLEPGQRRLLFETIGPGPWRVGLGLRTLALVAPLLDPAAVASLDAVTPEPDGIPGRFLLHAGGALERMV